MTSNDLMDIAWRDFILWARTEPDIITQFEEETGRAFPKSQLDLEIDNATGNTKAIEQEFLLWVTESWWGVDEAPETVRLEIPHDPNS